MEKQFSSPQAVVAVVGRPNVGKSTLFNRILGLQRAIVHDVGGVTRDRHYAEAEWAGKTFTVIDTGGYVPKSSGVIERAVREQARIAIEEADAVIFVVDASVRPTGLDLDIAEVLRKSRKRVLLAANKVDSPVAEPGTAEYFSLGLGSPFPISALTGRNIGDFLDLVVKDFPRDGVNEGQPSCTKVAIVGRPNVGKSALVNALLGKERAIVTEIPGTTRDSIDSLLTDKGEEYLLIDTAGLRKRSAVKESIEFYSVIRTLRSISRCDVAIVMVDATIGLEKQDLRIIATVAERKKGIVIAVNKWDLVEARLKDTDSYVRLMKRQLRRLNYAPIILISAKTKLRIHQALEVARRVREERAKRIDGQLLHSVMLKEIETTPPAAAMGRQVRIHSLIQLKTTPPVFAFKTNQPTQIKEDYKRSLENKLRKYFGFEGVPLTLVFRRN
jgi:GTP-binding protein